MNDRLSSGHARLDEILHGGLFKNSITLVVGVPGSGKTILCQQFVFHNATIDRPALYLTTVTEPFDKILRYGESLDFFDATAVRERRVIYEDLGHAVTSGGLDAVLSTLGRFLKELRPSMVVIDSFRGLHAFAKDEGAFRQFLDGLTRQLTASSATALWIDEYPRGEAQNAAEFAVADGIIALDTKQLDDREHRTLQVLKLRGSGFQSGQHGYRISSRGLDVFPRLADLQDWAVRQAQQSKFRTVGVYAGALGYSFNTEQLKKKNIPEPKCWSDLVKPAFKDEIQVANPNSSAPSSAPMTRRSGFPPASGMAARSPAFTRASRK